MSSIATSARPFVLLLRAYDASGTPIALGSGFIGPDGRVITNAHVVAGAARVEVADAEGQLLLTTTFAEALSTTVDLAVLPRISGRAHGLPLSRKLPPIGERIVVIGAPEGLTYTVTDGIVSGLRQMGSGSWVQISAPISPGSSGGPVLNRRGEVIGVSVATLRAGQNLNFAVPTKDVFALLNSPPGRVAFPSGTSLASARSRGNADVSSTQDVRGDVVTRKDFRVQLSRCERIEGGRVGCELQLSNTAAGRTGTRQFYVQNVKLSSIYGTAIKPESMLLGSQSAASIRGLIVSDLIDPGTTHRLIIVFGRFPAGVTKAILSLTVAPGAGFPNETVSLNVVALQ